MHSLVWSLVCEGCIHTRKEIHVICLKEAATNFTLGQRYRTKHNDIAINCDENI